MKTAGIIAEYNPFHNGHAYHIKKTRENGFSHIVAVMSGSFTQRGEPACMLKNARCAAALSGGADLVIELPLPWAAASAETFAYGGVFLLNALGCVNTLSFGSESGDTPKMQRYADRLLLLNGSQELKSALKSGVSFPAARQAAYRELFHEETADLSSPNDLLGIEYIKALKKTGSKMTPLAIKRLGAMHDEIHINQTADKIVSASQIRSLLAADEKEKALKFVPENAKTVYNNEIILGRAPFQSAVFEKCILSYLRRLSKDDFLNIPDVGEGIENRIIDAIRQAAALGELCQLIKTKRYTLSRIRRILLCAYLGIDKSCSASPPPYIRVLGFNQKGLELLKVMKKTAALPVVTRYSDIEPGTIAGRIFTLESRASDLYTFCLPKPLPCGFEQTYQPVRHNIEI